MHDIASVPARAWPWVKRTGCFLNRRNRRLPKPCRVSSSRKVGGWFVKARGDGVLSRTPQKKNSLKKRCTIFSLSHSVTYCFLNKKKGCSGTRQRQDYMRIECALPEKGQSTFR
jgi:hypothetical protein